MINSQVVACVGLDNFEIAQAIFAKVKSFSNVTGEGSVVTSSIAYEYFSVTFGETTCRMGLKYVDNNTQFFAGIATSSDSGGNISNSYQMNSTIANVPIVGELNLGTRSYNVPAKYFTYVRIFTDSNNRFVGLSGWHTTTHKAPVTLMFARCNGKYYMFDPRGIDGILYDIDPNHFGEYYYTELDNGLSIYYESVDSVVMDQCRIRIDEIFYPVDDFYYIWNNQLFSDASSPNTNGFIIIGTESEGMYMSIYKEKWIKYEKTIGTEIVEYSSGS